MIKHTVIAFSALALVCTLTTQPAQAQGAQSRAVTGDYGRTSATSNNARRSDSVNTMNQRIGGLRTAGLGGVAQIHGPRGRNGLPPTSLDSFVLNAGGSAEQIYGDEGTSGPPPYFEFTMGHRIQTGITGQRAAGLTTGHGSYMPCAWGGDEFVDGPEFSMSGSGNGGATWSVDLGPEGNAGQRGDLAGDNPWTPTPGNNNDHNNNNNNNNNQNGNTDDSGF